MMTESVARCEACGLEHGLWTAYVEGLGRQHERAPLGFDGSTLRAYGNRAIDQVEVTEHIDVTRPGMPGVWLCQWCADDLRLRWSEHDRRRSRLMKSIRALCAAGQRLLPSLVLVLSVGCATGGPVSQDRARVLDGFGGAAPSAVPTTSPTPTGVRMAFTQAGGHLDGVMVAGLGQATTHVDAAMYAINRPNVVQAFVDAQHRCSCVRMISDATQSGGRAQKVALLKMQSQGIPIMVDQHSGIMHLKVVGVNLAVVYEGSYNETDPASTVNDEVLFTIPSAEIAVEWHSEFETMWNDTKRFKAWTPSAAVNAPAPDDF